VIRRSIAEAGDRENIDLHRILYIEEGPAIGGSTYTLLHLIAELDRSRFEPFVIFRHELPVGERFAGLAIPTASWASIGGRPGATAAPQPPARIHRAKRTAPYRLLWSAKKYAREQRHDAALLATWMRRERFDLIHANNAVSVNIGAIVAARRLGIPAISHQRGFFRLTPLHRFLSRRVKRFICVSNAVREHYIGQGLSQAAVQTIHDGIDLRRYAPRPRDRSRGFLVGWFARFERWKGCFTFAEAARIVLDAQPAARFIMAGTGPEENAVRRMVASDPIFTDRFIMPGFRSDAVELMSRCDIVVNSSIEPEPLSNTALEALALGIPAVVSNVGGNPEIVAHGENGYVFDQRDPESLAAALIALGADEELRARFGKAGRLRAERLFDARRYAADLQSLYADILGS
jgi:glycosyltransferase involved in cell wall biosynthesis